MSERGRSISPRADDDVEMANGDAGTKNTNAKVVIVTNLTRNVVQMHLRTIFGFYGKIVKVDLPLYAQSGQNRGKAALEYSDAESAHTAASHMHGGQLDGNILKVELSDLPIRPRSRSRSRPRPARNGRARVRSYSRSRSRTQSPPRRRGYRSDRPIDSYRGRPYGRRAPPGRDTYRPRTRSRSPIRAGGALPPRRRSPSYERGGYGRSRRSPSYSRSRSRSFSVRSSRSRTRSLTPSRSRSRSTSSYYRYSRSRSRSKSRSRSRSQGRRSVYSDDIRDSRSRSPQPA